MQPENRLYMQRQPDMLSGRRKPDALEPVESEAAAVEAIVNGKSKSATVIRLCEIAEMEWQGETLKGAPKNWSADIHVGVDRIASLEDYIAYQRGQQAYYADPQNNTAQSGLLRSMFEASAAYYQGDEFEKILEAVAAQPPETRYAVYDGLELGRFRKLEEGGKAYDRKGQMIWPPAAPLPSADNTLDI